MQRCPIALCNFSIMKSFWRYLLFYHTLSPLCKFKRKTTAQSLISNLLYRFFLILFRSVRKIWSLPVLHPEISPTEPGWSGLCSFLSHSFFKPSSLPRDIQKVFPLYFSLLFLSREMLQASPGTKPASSMEWPTAGYPNTPITISVPGKITGSCAAGILMSFPFAPSASTISTSARLHSVS